MSKRPSIKRAGKLTIREWIWSEIRDAKTVTTQQLIKKAPKHYKLDAGKARYYLNGWEKSGYLTVEQVQYRQQPPAYHYEYTLVKDTGVNPPRVDDKGKPVTTGMGREQMWRTLRIIGQFDYKQLAATASTDDIVIAESEAASYVSHLHKAGYLKCIKPANHSGGLAVYMLIPAAWTGAKPPMVKRMNVVFDQNKHKVVWPKEEEIQGDY